MPIEYIMLKDAPRQLVVCPACGEPWEPFMRGMVQRDKFSFMECFRAAFGNRAPERRPYCAMICWECKELVGYEDPIEPANFILKQARMKK